MTETVVGWARASPAFTGDFFAKRSSSVGSVSSAANDSYLAGASLFSGNTTDSRLAVSYGFEDHRNAKTQGLNQFRTNLVS
jgi:hypothetical protein